MSVDLANNLSTTAFAFRGYNVTNLGRTRELLGVSAYREIITARLDMASKCCSEVCGKPIDLLRRVEAGEEAGLDEYAEAIGIIYAVELAQIDLLREVHQIEFRDSRMAFGYSLGELVAVASAGVFPEEPVLRVPLSMAGDCASLAHDVTMGIIFSRGAALHEPTVHKVCEEISCDMQATLGVSAILSPNTLLVLGQGETIKQLKPKLREALGLSVHIRINDSQWPPLHTSIIWQKAIADRASVMVSRIPKLADTPKPTIFSLVTGQLAYADEDCRAVFRKWIDQPQRLWDAVLAVLRDDVRTVVHVGPEPNVIPATFSRLSDNVQQQTGAWSLEGFGMRAVQQIANRPWLTALLPHQGSLLRAPSIQHVVLEDWLLGHAPS